jgi:hypothetical protein
MKYLLILALLLTPVTAYAQNYPMCPVGYHHFWDGYEWLCVPGR